MRSWRDEDEVGRQRLGLARERRVSRRRLTARGRITLLILGAAIAIGAHLALPTGVEVASPVALAAAALPAVGAAAPGHTVRSVASNPQWVQPAPLSLLARIPSSRSTLSLRRSASGTGEVGATSVAYTIDPAAAPRFVEWLPAPADAPHLAGPLRVEYSLDAKLSERVFRVLRKALTKRGHVVVLDVRSGRVLAYASTDADALPPGRAYPAASLAKVVTAAAALGYAPRAAKRPCLYRGSPYRLTRSRVNPTRGGIEASLAKAIARSYNQCFAQLAVHALGEQPLLQAFRRFGWQESPAAGHEPGAIERGEGDYDLGKLGSGLAGSRITVLHAAQLAATLAEGNLIEPWWIDRIVDAEGRSLGLPRRGVRRSVMKRAVADELRSLLVGTTTRGTARSAFRNRRGRPRLDDVRVAGKTGNLSGRDPRGRYEWFAGVAPADDPRIAVAVLQLHDRLWWRTSAQIAGDVFGEVFCERSRCSEERAARFTGDLRSGTAPLLLMDPSPAEER